MAKVKCYNFLVRFVLNSVNIYFNYIRPPHITHRVCKLYNRDSISLTQAFRIIYIPYILHSTNSLNRYV